MAYHALVRGDEPFSAGRSRDNVIVGLGRHHLKAPGTLAIGLLLAYTELFRLGAVEELQEIAVRRPTSAQLRGQVHLPVIRSLMGDGRDRLAERWRSPGVVYEVADRISVKALDVVG